MDQIGVLGIRVLTIKDYHTDWSNASGIQNIGGSLTESVTSTTLDGIMRSHPHASLRTTTCGSLNWLIIIHEIMHLFLLFVEI